MLTHTWIDQYRKTQPQVYEALADVANGSVQFDCGVADDIPISKNVIDPSEARAPFPRTLLQFETPGCEYSHVLVLWQDVEDGSVVLTAALRTRTTKEWKTMAPCRITRTTDGYHYEKIGYSETSKNMAMICHAMALNLFFVLGCSNVTTINNKEPAALNKKRAKAGKYPVLSHKTLVLVIDEEKTTGQASGGTHSSPRVHLRRGHIRRLQSGSRVWVQPCVVGSKHGVVLKDYRVTKKETLTAIGSS